jgi:hypothetical protein
VDAFGTVRGFVNRNDSLASRFDGIRWLAHERREERRVPSSAATIR